MLAFENDHFGRNQYYDYIYDDNVYDESLPLDYPDHEQVNYNYQDEYSEEVNTIDGVTDDMDSLQIEWNVNSLTLLPDKVCNFLYIFTTLIS